MATDINPPSESWGTLQMKPDPSEEGNALWADKIAANEGWLFNRSKGQYLLLSECGGGENVAGGARTCQAGADFHFRFYSTGQGTLEHHVSAAISLGTYQISIGMDGGTSTPTYCVEEFPVTRRWYVNKLSITGMGTGWLEGRNIRGGTADGNTYKELIFLTGVE